MKHVAVVVALVLCGSSAWAQGNSTQVNTELPNPAALADNLANPTITAIAAYELCWDSASSNWDRCPKDRLVSNAGVFAVQESGAALTSLGVIDNIVNTLASTTSGQSGVLGLGAVTTAPPSYTTATTNALSLDTAGSLRVAIISGAGSGGTAMTEGAVFTVNSTSITPVGGEYESSPSACTSGRACVLGLTTAKAAKVTLYTAAGTALSQDTQFQDDTALGTKTLLTGGGMFGYASAAAPTDVTADGDAVAGWFARNGAQMVNLTAAGTLIAAGTGTAATSIRVNIATDDLVNDAAVKFDANLVAHDAVDAGNPLKIGYKAIAHGTNPTAVAAGDRTDAYANRAGVPFVIGGHPNVLTYTAQVTDADGAQTGIALVTCGSGCKVVVTRASVKCSNANSSDVDFRLAFDTDSTLTAQSEAGVAGEITAFDDIPAGGGAVEGSGSGILGVGADGEDLRYSLSDPVGGSCTISVSAYTIES